MFGIALPVAVAIMTPILPTIIVLYQRLRNSKCFANEEKKEPLVTGVTVIEEPRQQSGEPLAPKY